MMAKFTGPIKFKGSVGGVTGYYDEDTGEYHLASKKPKNKNQNKDSPRALDMENEFKGVCMWLKSVRVPTSEFVYLKKGRLAGKLNAIGKQIQLMAPKSDYGFRAIESSKFNYPLVGFSFNNAHPFRDVFQVVPEVCITDDRSQVTLSLNDFRSASKFKWPEAVHYYRISLLIFVLADVTWNETWDRYTYVNWPARMGQKWSVSEWLHVDNVSIDFQLSAAFREGQLPGAKSTVVVVMGLEFASAMQNNSPYVVKGIGTAGVVVCL